MGTVQGSLTGQIFTRFGIEFKVQICPTLRTRADSRRTPSYTLHFSAHDDELNEHVSQ